GQAVLADLVRTIGQLDLDGDVLPRLGLRQHTAVGAGEDEADGVRRLLPAAGDDEVAPDVTGDDVVAGVELLLGLDQRVCHVPVDLGQASTTSGVAASPRTSPMAAKRCS